MSHRKRPEFVWPVALGGGGTVICDGKEVPLLVNFGKPFDKRWLKRQHRKYLSKLNTPAGGGKK